MILEWHAPSYLHPGGLWFLWLLQEQGGRRGRVVANLAYEGRRGLGSIADRPMHWTLNFDASRPPMAIQVKDEEEAKATALALYLLGAPDETPALLTQ